MQISHDLSSPRLAKLKKRDYTDSVASDERGTGLKRIIYVTGMKPKPDPAVHRPALVRVLGAALGRQDQRARDWLSERESNFRLVSWTPLLHPEIADIGPDLPGIERLLADPEPDPADRQEADAPGRSLRRAWHLIGDSSPWLSRFMATPALRVTLKDVQRYLCNTDGVADAIRQRLIRELVAAWDQGESVLLIGHSLGSVIAYDSLWQLSRERCHQGRVGLLMTLGSPLATRFIRKHLKGSDRSGADRFPDNIDRWVNAAARGEMVALHRRLYPFFGEMQRLGLLDQFTDLEGIYSQFRVNGELNVHKSYGYLHHPAIAGLIADWLLT